ncbi:ATP-binding protein [Desulfococcaceae bacterium HSG8]|nr:ATP-binding protein [Desulfococcaceae bacterium HSG8]
MRNIVGQTPRGKDFFPRDKLVNLIYRRLDSGSNVFMAAPRRVGKTAIMRHLEDNPREGYECKYIMTESVTNEADYFKLIMDTLHRLKAISARSLEAIGSFLSKINEIGVLDFSLAFAETRVNWFEELKTLLKELDTGGKTIVIMVDEFPQTVENILRESGKGKAEQFLQFNREIRHQANENIRFILTGSIGLPTMAEKLDATKEINDLNTVEITPLSEEEAREFIGKLLDHENVSYEQGVIGHLLNKIEWFVPFHIQLLVQELIDEYDNTGKTVNEAVADKAFANIFQMRNNMYFEHYYSRLKKTFDQNEYPFALAVLDELTGKDELTVGEIRGIAQAHNLTNYPVVMRTLEFDGYIFGLPKADGEKLYRFTSPVLMLWWRSYVK